MPKSFSAPPAMEIDPSKRYVAEKDTSMGSMTIELDPAAAPMVVSASSMSFEIRSISPTS